MKIGILGSGNVGQTLAKGFLGLGYEVKVGSRDPKKLDDWLTKTANASASTGTFAEAAEFGEVIVLAMHGLAALDAIDLAGKISFTGKIVIDVTNPLDFSKGSPALVGSFGDSLGDKIQKHLPDAKVVKAFNIVNCNIMINARLEEGSPDMFIAGNDADAKAWVSELCSKWGWSGCHDMGDITSAYWLETLAMVWIVFGVRNQHWTHAFKLLKK
jgi:8-hydroxy-5-deazaflavin:NADPH oxidoreductase